MGVTKFPTILFLFAIICSTFVVFASGQMKEHSEINSNSSCCNRKGRRRLNQRLKLLVAFQVAQDYDGIYSLLTKNKNDPPISSMLEMERSSDKAGRAKLTAFMVERINVLRDFSWSYIDGCGKYQSERTQKFLESQVEAYWVNGDWFFAYSISPSNGVDSAAQKCSFKRK